MRTMLPLLVLSLAGCAGAPAPAAKSDPNVVAVGKTTGPAPGASALAACDPKRGAALEVDQAEGAKITERCILGASPETKAAIEKTLTLGRDKTLTAEVLRRDLEGAYATRLVDQIEATARREGTATILFLTVTERPKIAEIAFEGFGPMKDERTSDALPKPGAPLRLAEIHALCEKLRSAYVSSGWDDAKVTHVVEPAGPGRVRLKLVAAEGTRAKVGKVTFDGATPGNHAPLRKMIELADGEPLSPDRLERAGLLVTAFYFDRGHLDVKVEEPKRTRGADGTTAIAWKVVEGPVYRIGKVAVSGLSGDAQTAALAKLTVKSGEVFNRTKVKADVDALDRRLAPSSAEPETKIDRKTRTVDLTFAVKIR